MTTEPRPFNGAHADLNHGKWCKCGVPIWRRGVDSPDRRETFDHRSKCRVCSLHGLPRSYVIDESNLYDALRNDNDEEDRAHHVSEQGAVSVMMPSQVSHARAEAQEQWGRTEIAKKHANSFIPLDDVWSDRMLPAIGSSTCIGYRARHVISCEVRRICRDALGLPGYRRATFYPLDLGFHGARRGGGRTIDDIRYAPDSDMCVTDEPRL